MTEPGRCKLTIGDMSPYPGVEVVRVEGKLGPDGKYHAGHLPNFGGGTGFGIRQAAAAGGVDHHVGILFVDARVVNDDLRVWIVNRFRVTPD